MTCEHCNCSKRGSRGYSIGGKPGTYWKCPDCGKFTKIVPKKREIITIEFDTEFEIFEHNHSIINNMEEFLKNCVGKDIRIKELK